MSNDCSCPNCSPIDEDFSYYGPVVKSVSYKEGSIAVSEEFERFLKENLISGKSYTVSIQEEG